MLFGKKKIGLALAGGGAKGLAHIGLLEVLEREGIPVDVISGTSIGAIIGANYALEPDIEKLKQTATSLVKSEMYNDLKLDRLRPCKENNWFDRIRNKAKSRLTFTEALLKPSLISEEPVKRFFDEFYDEKKFEDTEIPFAAVALDLVSGEDVIFREGLIKDALRASTAIPGIFPAVEMDGRLLVDGGVTANDPVLAARELGADVVIGIIFGYDPRPVGRLKNSMDVILRGDQLAKLKLFRMLISKADYVVEIDTGDIHWTDFGRLEECIEMGCEAAKRNVDGLRKAAGGNFFRRYFKLG
ncbi:MAG TPA: patatin-like phospholipase family protein [Candidatus Krumholzibacteriaceae bacterium]|nr:patatin-like phospholipase family protein [Candidatus Krumholzibacteriaceae bacterium]